MTTTIAGMRPDPRVRPAQLQDLIETCNRAAADEQGAIVFLAGPRECGRRATLAALAQALHADKKRFFVLAGAIQGGEYQPFEADDRKYSQWMSLLGEALGLSKEALATALAANPPLGLVVGVTAQLLQLGAAVWPVVSGEARANYGNDENLPLVLKRNLRRAAEKRPVVFLLDGLDEAQARFLTTFLFASGPELIHDRRLCIVAGMDGPAVLGDHEEDEPGALYVARSLTRRGLARWLPVLTMTRKDLQAWLGPAEDSLVTLLHEVSGGYPAYLAELWDELYRHGKVQPHPDTYRWEAARGFEMDAQETIWDLLTERLQDCLDEDDPEEFELNCRILAVAALEGETFTAVPVALTYGCNPDELIDFIDDLLVADEDGIGGVLEEVEGVTISGADEERCLWRYRFASPLFRSLLDRHILDDRERAELSLILAQNLAEAYGSQAHEIAPTLARLFEAGGEADQARHYRETARNVGSAREHYLDAQVLMSAPRDMWGPADYARAATQLNEVASETHLMYPFRVTLAIAEAALECARAGPSLCEEARALHSIGAVYSALGKKEEALAFDNQALPLLKQCGDVAGEATTLHNMGAVYSALGQKEQALAFYNQALPLLKRCGDVAGEAKTLHNIGRVYSDLGQTDRALAFYNQALPLLKQCGDVAGEAATLNSIGGVYSDLGHKEEALASYNQALPLIKQCGHVASEAKTLNNIGAICDDLGQKEQALVFYERALPLFRQCGDVAGEATALHNIGGAYSDLGQNEQALAFYDQAILLFQQCGDHWGEAATRYFMSYIFRSQGRLEDAERELVQVVAIDEEFGRPDLESDRAALAALRAQMGLG